MPGPLPLTVLLLAATAPAPAVDPQVVAARLLAEETISQGAWKKLEWLTDRIGHRLSGSPAAARAVEWGLAEMKRDGLDNVRPEKVWVTHWVRGDELVELTDPVQRRLAALTLGNSVGTDEHGVSGRIVEVETFEDIARKQAELPGAILFANKQIKPNGGERDGYGAGARLRYAGPAEAAKFGAVGMIIRSLGTASLRTPHTGSTGYEDGVEKIPAAAISIEDAEHLQRLLRAGERPEVCLRLGARMLPDAESANVIGELRGREKPEEVIVIGGHLDSWDVGQGAVDDGAGVVVAMEALRLLRKLDLRPRRTIRAVLFMNEENGLKGGHGYAAAHLHELDRHVGAIESDGGAGQPLGLSLDAGPGAREMLAGLLAPLRGIGAEQVIEDEGTGADISPLRPYGVPLMGLRQDMTRYFEWHHTEADTLDKVDPDELVRNVVAMAYAAWALAEAPGVLPRGKP